MSTINAKTMVANATVTKENKMTDEQERALRNLESAASAVKRGVGGKAAEGMEKKYGQAYQECVKLGIKPQIRKRYR